MPSHPTLRFPTLHSSSASHSSNNNSSSTVSAATIDSMSSRVVLSSKSTLTTTSGRSHPMMQMTLPLDDDNNDSNSVGFDTPIDPLSSPQGPALHEASGAASRFADVKVSKKRVFSAPSLTRSFSKGASDKIPSLSRSSSKGASDRMPSLSRSSSATAATATRFVSKMAPMLRRVVSGTAVGSGANGASDSDATSDVAAPPISPRTFLESDDDARDSLLFMMQVPVVRRKSHIPLMSLSHVED